MYVKNSNFAIYLGLAVVVGFGLSFLIGGLGTESGLMGGDISKASRYSNQKEDPAFTVIEEKLRSDKEFFNNTKGAISFLQNRMEVLSELSEETLAACEGISEFDSLMEELKSLNAKSFNTASAMVNAGRSLDKIADGKNAPEYEVYSNMAFIGFGKVEAGMNFGRRFYETVNAFLVGKPFGQYQTLADLASVWAVYCTEDAYLNSSEEELAFWLPGFGNTEQQEEDSLIIVAFTPWGSNNGSQGNPNDSTGTVKGGGSTGPDGNNWHIHINLIGNSALGEYLNSLSTACEKVRAAGIPESLRNVAEEQLKDSFQKHVASEQVRNSASEQVRNSAAEQVRNSAAEQVRNSAAEQVRNSAQDAMRAAFPGEMKGGLKAYIQLINPE